MAEEARLESVYTSKAYPEFESRSLRPGRQQSSFFYVINNLNSLDNVLYQNRLCELFKLFITTGQKAMGLMHSPEKPVDEG